MASREQAVPPATTLAFDKTTTGIDEPIKRGVAPGEREGAQVAIKPWSETASEIQVHSVLMIVTMHNGSASTACLQTSATAA